MSDVHIKSKNQSGGITAQNVNTGGAKITMNVGPTEGRLKAVFWWIFGVVGLAAACVTTYKFFFAGS
jgi:hypothetical protein